MQLHHVVFCVQPEHQDHAADLWRALGLTFHQVDLDDLGIRVLIDWNAGIEIIAPRSDAGEEASDFRHFLEERGEGFYSVVMGVSEVDGPAAIAARYGVPSRYRQHREEASFRIDEVMLEPLHGMSVTFLATDPPM